MSDEPEPNDLLATAKARFKFVCEVDNAQKKREQDDLRFQVPEFQWDEAARRQRLGITVDGVPTPARPCLSISKLDHPIQLVLNQERQAHLGINIHPVSPDADDETAEIYQGIYRAIERNSHANQARSWAFDRAVKCGRGFYRVNTAYDKESDDSGDQVITIERILRQDCVYFDSSATKPDYSDADFAFVTAYIPIKRFEALFPNAATTAADMLEFQDQATDEPDWVRVDGDQKAVLVAEYWYKERSDEEVGRGKNKRKREDVTVKCCKLTGFEILEEYDWAGKHIPLIQVTGRELQPFDTERRFVGVIGPNKDAQRVFNYAASNAIELVALEPRAPFIGAEGQFEGHESEWQQSNTRNFPYLEYKPTAVGGDTAPPPARSQVDVGRLGPTMQLLMQADQFLQAGTAAYDPSLGRSNSKEKSGIAIKSLQGQFEAGSSNYIMSLADISMTYEAEVILDLIPKIYDRPGRVTRTLDTEDDTEAVMLNQPYITHPRTKRPVPVDVVEDAEGKPAEPLRTVQPLPPMGPPGPQGPMPSPKVKFHDLSKGVYNVAVSVGRSRQTQLEEGADEIGQLLQAQPQLMPLIGPIYFKFRDFPGAREIADIMAKMRDKQFPGLASTQDEMPTAEQSQAQVQGLQQQLQQMQQQLQGAATAIKTEQAKQQAMLQKAQLDNQTKIQIAAMDAESKAQIEKLQGQIELLNTLLKQEHENKQGDKEMAHDVALEGVKAGHQVRQQAASATAPDMTIKPPSMNQVPGTAGIPLETGLGEPY